MLPLETTAARSATWPSDCAAGESPIEQRDRAEELPGNVNPESHIDIRFACPFETTAGGPLPTWVENRPGMSTPYKVIAVTESGGLVRYCGCHAELPMITRTAAAAILCAAACISLPAQTAPSSVSSDPEQKINSTLHQMYEAEKRRDLKFVLAHLAEDFAEVAGDGKIYHRSDIEAGWNDVELKAYKLSDCVFRLMASDAAYLSCNLEVEATYKGKAFPQRVRVTTVWTPQQSGQWVIRFEQGTIIPESAKKE